MKPRGSSVRASPNRMMRYARQRQSILANFLPGHGSWPCIQQLPARHVHQHSSAKTIYYLVSYGENVDGSAPNNPDHAQRAARTAPVTAPRSCHSAQRMDRKAASVCSSTCTKAMQQERWASMNRKQDDDCDVNAPRNLPGLSGCTGFSLSKVDQADRQAEELGRTSDSCRFMQT